MTQNPYAPPRTEPSPITDAYEKGLIWREDDVLCIRNGAALPNRCFVTGEVTKNAFLVSQFWQPTWVYLLLIPALIPYLIASPILGKYLNLEVPLSERIYKRHLRTVRVGFAILLASGTAFSIGLFAAFNRALDPLLVALLTLQAVPFGMIGFVLASQPPMRLKVVSFEGDVLKLRGIHPDCMAAVPNEFLLSSGTAQAVRSQH